ncbi:alpha/beta hydrolase [Methyloligella sp. 2.7D]|uniref:alpha/beta hydrolase n=1 Tax=unclassified Methyloligella TaxID=2625955 RepID=UPI00157D50EB|nr:alpha/beta hydrolase [Methyloligella sp. GL2]QKP77935.1 alpha/beta hydrolase [Methyloligella sp. GL2]
MTKSLNPVLADILKTPSDPNAVPVEKQTPDEARAEFTADMKAVDAAPPEIGEVRDLQIPCGDVSCAGRLFVPAELVRQPAPLLIYYHGGGNIRGSVDTHDSTCRVLANASGCKVLSVDYRLAPEHPFPAAVEDAFAAYVWAIGEAGAETLGIDPARIAVGGDSAGGNLAAVVCLLARDKEIALPSFQLLIYPVTDHVSETESKRLYSNGYMLDSMPFYTASYLPEEETRKDPQASPAYAESFAGLPPAYVLTAGFDPLHDDDVAYADKLREAGVAVTYRSYQDMIHGFVSLRGLLPEAEKALNECGAAVKDALR